MNGHCKLRKYTAMLSPNGGGSYIGLWAYYTLNSTRKCKNNSLIKNDAFVMQIFPVQILN